MIKQIYTADNPASAHMLKDILDQNGIKAVIQGEQAFSMGGVCTGGIMAAPTVWVFEADVKAALEIVNEFRDSFKKQ